MRIIPGIRIFSRFDMSNKIELCGGTTNHFLVNKELYSENSFVPQLPWRKPNADEQKILIANNVTPKNYSSHISIIKIPDTLSTKVLNYFNKISPDEKNIDFSEKDDFLLATANIVEYIEENYLIEEDKFEIAGYAINDVFHLITSTYDTMQNKYTGIHLDDWSDGELHKRETAPNRICINFGKEVRYFLFINLTMVQIFDMCAIDDKDIVAAVKRHPGLLLNYFFKKFSNYPVVKVSLDPGEAYIAPTENIPHDGSTYGNKSTDISLTFRGFFKL